MERDENNIETLFYAETKDKKRIASNAHRIGSAVHRRCTLPHEMLKGKERKKYMEPTNEKTYKMEPMTLKEFKALPEDLKPELLKWYGNKFGWTTSAVSLALEVSFRTAGHLLEQYNMAATFAKNAELQTREFRRTARLNREALIEARKHPHSDDNAEGCVHESPETEKPATGQKNGTSGDVSFLVNLTCTAELGETLSKRLAGIAQSLAPDEKYRIMFTLRSADEEA